MTVDTIVTSRMRTELPLGWRTVRFDAMAENVNDRIDDPSEAGVEYYVGLEHLDPESLKIRRWGKPTDVEATKLRFKPGDIIFGRRRAYQRKLAVADFEGICSAHAMVLRAREDVVLPELLPFFMQSDIFFERAMSISVGSLSPTINWKTLAVQEFALPPRDEQRRIAEILWAADEAVEADLEVICAVDKLRRALLENFLTEGLPAWHKQYVHTDIGRLPESWKCMPCEQLLVEGPRNGLSPEANANGDGYPTLSISAVRDGLVVPAGNTKFAVISEEDAQRFRLNAHDILVVRGNGNKNLVGRCGIVQEVPEGCFYPDLLIKLRFDESIIYPEFACLQWNIASTHYRLIARAKSTNGIWKVNGKDVRQHLLAVPPLDEQEAVLKLIESQTLAGHCIHERLERAKDLKHKLIEKLMIPES